MKKLFSIKILLLCQVDSREVYEETLILVKLDNIDDLKDKVYSYVEKLNEEYENKIFNLVSILDYYEISDEIEFPREFVQIYSRFINREELDLYPEF
ncbi:hypothetical protein [Lagierella sp.]|uniref:hypothetical protein n=1 Tax=Lagierella sp. TaxID=2849657 RepID=UPI002614788A|nr:hypothetical protein [Lagierella sp.]